VNDDSDAARSRGRTWVVLVDFDSDVGRRMDGRQGEGRGQEQVGQTTSQRKEDFQQLHSNTTAMGTIAIKCNFLPTIAMRKGQKNFPRNSCN